MLLISVTTPLALHVATAGLSGVATFERIAPPLGRGGQFALVVQDRMQALMMVPTQLSPASWQGTPVLHGCSEEFEQTFEALQVPGSVENPI